MTPHRSFRPRRAKLALVRLPLFVPYDSDVTDSLGVGLVEKGHLLGQHMLPSTVSTCSGLAQAKWSRHNVVDT